MIGVLDSDPTVSDPFDKNDEAVLKRATAAENLYPEMISSAIAAITPFRALARIRLGRQGRCPINFIFH